VTVVLEDGTALLGLNIAFSCIALSFITNDPFYDACGSVIIGCMLGMGSSIGF
jgi:zinc transporter 9